MGKQEKNIIIIHFKVKRRLDYVTNNDQQPQLDACRA